MVGVYESQAVTNRFKILFSLSSRVCIRIQSRHNTCPQRRDIHGSGEVQICEPALCLTGQTVSSRDTLWVGQKGDV